MKQWLSVKITTLQVAVAGLLALSCAGSHAQTLPAYYPKSFAIVVPIDSVNYQQRSLVAGDVPFRIAQDAVVHSPTSKEDSIFALRPGVVVGFTNGNPGPELRELWIVPKSMQRELVQEQ